MGDPVMQTPLNQQVYTTEGLAVSELPPSAKINLRGDVDVVSDALMRTDGLSAQMAANTFTAAGAATVFWLGPDERLLCHTEKEPQALIDQLRETLPSATSAAVDVSDYYTVIQLSGSNARAVLASGTPLDIHPSVFAAGQCAQTRFGNASVLLSCKPDGIYDLQVRWSFARYVYQYICRVAGYVQE